MISKNDWLKKYIGFQRGNQEQRSGELAAMSILQSTLDITLNSSGLQFWANYIENSAGTAVALMKEKD